MSEGQQNIEKKKKKKEPSLIVTSTTVRKHKIENINRNQIATYLDQLYAEGGALVEGGLNISLAIGGVYEVISFKDEVAQ